MSEFPPVPLDNLIAPVPPASDEVQGGPTSVSPVESQSGPRKAALGFIFLAALMDIVAIGVIIPVLPRLVQQFAGGDTATAIRYVGVFSAVFALMQFIFAPILGGLSDRFGRRPVLLFSIFGLGFDYLIMANAPNMGWLFVGRVISGITAASFSTANAYIADITPPEKRAQSFGLMGAAFGIGFIIGPAVGGLLGEVSPRLPFWVAAGLALLNGVYGLFILPESLPKDRRSPFSLAKANPLGSFRLLASHPELLTLGVVTLLFYLSHQAIQTTAVLYTVFRYNWSTLAMGGFLAAIGLGNIIVQASVVRPFVARFKERGALYTGLVFMATGMFVFGWAPNGVSYCLGVPLFALSGLIQPGLQGMMTRRVGPNEQGRLQGANSGLMALAGLFGPIIFTQVFARCISGPRITAHPGVPYYLGSALLVIAIGVAVLTRRASPEVAAP